MKERWKRKKIWKIIERMQRERKKFNQKMGGVKDIEKIKNWFDKKVKNIERNIIWIL